MPPWNLNSILESNHFYKVTIRISQTSPTEWDNTRAPVGKRVMTISTHTKLGKWWDLFHHDHNAYEKEKEESIDLIFRNTELILPGLKEATDFYLPGTPVSFQNLTNSD